MKELKDLLVKKNYEVKKVDGKISAREKPKGKYRATCVQDVEDMLNNGKANGDVFVRFHTWGKWHKVNPPRS